MVTFWIGFHIAVAAMIFMDLRCFKKHPFAGVVVWIGVALLFNVGIGFFLGGEAALTFFTAYLIEKSLSIDNLFVFFMVFSFFGIKTSDQHRVLFLGIIGALVCRIVFILLGITLIETFTWMYFVFGGILCASAVYLWNAEEVKIEDTFLFRFLTRILRIEKGDHKGHFFIMRNGKLYVTSLFLSLMFVEGFDLLFAVDSVPAVLAITKDPFLAYTSNVFAILGLRSLYHYLSELQEKMQCLKPAILCILLFVGIKMILSPFLHIPGIVSLIIIVLILMTFFFRGKRS